MDRNAVNSLLVKLGMAEPEKLPEDRALNRITVKVKKSGLPAGLTSEEKAVVTELGLAGAPVNETSPTPAATKPKAAPAAAEPPAVEKEEPEAQGTDDSTPVPHRLKGINGNPDRVQVITPKQAAVRNRKRSEDKAITAFWEMDPSIDPAKVPPEGMSIPNTDAPKKPVAKTEKPQTPNQETTVAKKNKKTGKGDKPVAETKTSTGGKATKPSAPAKGKTTKAVKAPKEKKDRTGTSAAMFKSIMLTGTAKVKDEVVEKVVAAGGASEASAKAYICWAKRDPKKTNPAKGGNPFGFRIEETKTKDGVKMIKLIK